MHLQHIDATYLCIEPLLCRIVAYGPLALWPLALWVIMDDQFCSPDQVLIYVYKKKIVNY